ncbi:FAD-dependent oxidoreductase [Devosia sp. A16]|uniref:FAD-dependent oxidoreductase n=1 Tax=Devosia sp. A16 TaxID=1736675 RepID=UPI0006D7B269|nr:FAD-dependent oxidoreductase [Devosia sp. A16]
MTRRIAVLGAGVLGACVAMLLARRGHRVTVYDKEATPVTCASRWHEGRIHLGYVYGADRTLNTARLLIDGAVRFSPVMSELLSCSLEPYMTPLNDIIAVHRRSVVDAATLADTFAQIDAVVRQHPGAARYLTDVSSARTRRLSRTEMAALSSSDDIVAAFEIPERSFNTQAVADLLAAALFAQPGVELRLGTTVTAARPLDSGGGRWQVETAGGSAESFDVVVNALWEGRLAIDSTAGVALPTAWSHRYRLGLFLRTGRVLDTPSALVSVGPFGDVKNYNGRDFYLSWYPVGKLAEGDDLILRQPPSPEGPDAARFIAAVRAAMGDLFPGVHDILDAAQTVQLRGGFVYAEETGALDDPRASIHRRDRFGIRRKGSYFSVDTGKYSTAPLLAERVVAAVGASA